MSWRHGSLTTQRPASPRGQRLRQHLLISKRSHQAIKCSIDALAFFTYLNANPGQWSRDPDFHALSHGESFNALLDSSRFRGDGLFVLDEPESALSFGAELRLLGQLMEMSQGGTAQIILSTHSPVLASFPGARVLELGDWGWRETQWDDLEVVSHYRGFLDSPERYLRHLR